MFENMMPLMLKTLGVTPESIQEISDALVTGIKTLNLNVATILTKVESVETRLASIEAAQKAEKENPNV